MVLTDDCPTAAPRPCTGRRGGGAGGVAAAGAAVGAAWRRWGRRGGGGRPSRPRGPLPLPLPPDGRLKWPPIH